MASLHKKWLFLWLMAISTRSPAAAELKIGVADADAPPIAVLSDNGNSLQGGLARELGELLAAELDLAPNFVLLARKRVEMSVENGRVDLICNANPGWFSNASRLQWSHEIYPQVEKALSLAGRPPIRELAELSSLRISVIRGYSYPSLEYLWNNNRSERVEEAHFELQLKSLQKRLSDVAIVSELSFAWWARQRPREAAAFRLHPLIVTSLPTMCALSPRSAVKLDAVNRAIDRLQKNGKFKALLARYQWQPD
nr:transporter substrate-binding domain-containing protein [Chromobacterium sp. ASV5]